MATMPEIKAVMVDMSKRELFAAMAMQGWIAGVAGHPCMDDYDGDDVAFAQHCASVGEAAVLYADALIAALARALGIETPATGKEDE